MSNTTKLIKLLCVNLLLCSPIALAIDMHDGTDLAKFDESSVIRPANFELMSIQRITTNGQWINMPHCILYKNIEKPLIVLSMQGVSLKDGEAGSYTNYAAKAKAFANKHQWQITFSGNFPKPNYWQRFIAFIILI